MKYALDPRNFLDDTYIFMFESLSYDSSVHNIDGVRNIISGTFMENSSHNLDGYDYASLLMYAGEVSKEAHITLQKNYSGTGCRRTRQPDIWKCKRIRGLL